MKDTQHLSTPGHTQDAHAAEPEAEGHDRREVALKRRALERRRQGAGATRDVESGDEAHAAQAQAAGGEPHTAAVPAAPNAPGRGSRTVVGSAQAGERAADSSSFSTLVVRELAAAPNMPFDKALNRVTKQVLAGLAPSRDVAAMGSGGGAGARVEPEQHPAMARSRGDAHGDGESKRAAVYVGNDRYQHVGSLSGAVSDATAVQGQLNARGYQDLGLHANQTGDQMRGVYQGASTNGELKKGDSLVLYYAGHGTDKGLLGVDAQPGPVAQPEGLVPHAAMQGFVNGASSRGVNTTLLTDACHSGAGADLMRGDQLRDLNASAKNSPLATLVAIAHEIDGVKGELARKLDGGMARIGARAPADPKRATRDVELMLEHDVDGEAEAELGALEARLHELAARFQAAAGHALKSAAQIDALTGRGLAEVGPCIDRMTNEIVQLVETRQLAEQKGAGGKKP